MRGQSDKFKGSAKEIAGKATGNKKLEVKGKAQRAVGNAKARAKDAKNKADKKANDFFGGTKDKTEDDNMW